MRARWSPWGPDMDVKIDPSWKEILQEQFNSPYFVELTRFVREA